MKTESESAMFERIQEELNKYLGGMQDQGFSRHDIALMQAAFIYGMKVGFLLEVEQTKVVVAALDRHADKFFTNWRSAT